MSNKEDNQDLEIILSEQVKEEDKSLQELFSDENLEKKADINTKQILAISKAVTFADRYNCQLLNDFVKNYITYSISKNRKGRGEFVESYKAKILEPLGLGGMFGGGEKDGKKED